MSGVCASCGETLRPVSGDEPMRRHSDWTVQYWDALAMEFLGGYGMYDDPMTDLFASRQRERTVVLCHPCSDRFVQDNPWVAKVVHAHKHDPVPA